MVLSGFPSQAIAWLFFALFSVQSFANSDSLIDRLSKDQQWHALIHYKKGSFYVDSSKFLLGDKATPKDELIANIVALQNAPQYVCHFPARAYWLSNMLGKKISLNRLQACDGLGEFLIKAPADEIILVFASENLSSPSSMMGHAFLKIAGKSKDDRNLEHAISYFTVIDTYNPVSLAHRSLYQGMDGMFALLPYKEQLAKYHQKEGRNVWEYSLDLNDYERTLIHLHLWELKGIPSTYADRHGERSEGG